MLLELSRPLPEGWGRVSQKFGENPARYAKFGLAGHSGLDYSIRIGTDVLATHRGILQIMPEDPEGYGIHVVVVGKYWKTLYAHLSEIFVPNGTPLNGGEVIAFTGNTGNSTGPHLHFGLKVTGMLNPAYRNYIDPVPFRV